MAQQQKAMGKAFRPRSNSAWSGVQPVPDPLAVRAWLPPRHPSQARSLGRPPSIAWPHTHGSWPVFVFYFYCLGEETHFVIKKLSLWNVKEHSLLDNARFIQKYSYIHAAPRQGPPAPRLQGVICCCCCCCCSRRPKTSKNTVFMLLEEKHCFFTLQRQGRKSSKNIAIYTVF